MKIGLEVLLPGLTRPEIERQAKDFADAVSASVEEATTRTKERGRADLRQGFPGARRVATILRGDFFAAKAGKPAAGYVYSAWFKRGHDILLGFAEGATITAPDGKRMLVPAGRSPADKAIARAALEAAGAAPRIQIIRTRAGKVLLVEHRDKETRVLGFLVRSIRLPKKFDAAALQPFADAVLGTRLIENLKAKGF